MSHTLSVNHLPYPWKFRNPHSKEIKMFSWMPLLFLCSFLFSSPALGKDAPSWPITLELKERLHIHDFNEQLIDYKLSFPDETVHPDNLTVNDENGQIIPHQLSDVLLKDGYLKQARLHIRSSLRKNETRRFTLSAGEPAQPPQIKSISIEASGNEALIKSNLLHIRVPYYPEKTGINQHPSRVPPPWYSLRRASGDWIGQGHLEAPEDVRVTGIQTIIQAEGPLFFQYLIRYTFNKNRCYEVMLTLQRGESHLLIDENMTNIQPADRLFFRYDYGKSLNPDGRLVVQNGLYNGDPRGTRSGSYGLNANEKGALPVQLTLYGVNSLDEARSIAFWRDEGEDAMLLAINRPSEWKTSERHIWDMRDAPENLYFYDHDDNKYLRTQICGRQRHWAMGMIPREDLVLPAIKEDITDFLVTSDPSNLPRGRNLSKQYTAGPEVQLWQELTTFNLNAYKELTFDFHESLDPWDENAVTESYEDYWLHDQGWTLRGNLFGKVNDWHWDASGGLVHAFGGVSRGFWIRYANSRLHWSAEERKHIRSLLIFLVERCNGTDFHMPHQSMLAGHPNFIIEQKFDLALGAAIFPYHPKAEQWKMEFINFYDEWLYSYSRQPETKPIPLGTRWMENISTYWLASAERVAVGAEAIRRYDGTLIFEDPRFEELMEWTIDCIVPGEGINKNRVLPVGAHSYGARVKSRLQEVAHTLRYSNLPLASELQWAISAGNEGMLRNPRESKLYKDFGPVMHYDHGGEQEAYLYLQQLNGRGYRWTGRTNGCVYYAAKGQRWSWNGAEENGDHLEPDKLPMFRVDEWGLGSQPVDELLYNFDFAQFYRANGEQEDYASRSVMMIRDDFIALLDQTSAGTEGSFQWWNYETYMISEFFNDTKFKDRRMKVLIQERFPFRFSWEADEDPTAGMMDHPDRHVHWIHDEKPVLEGKTFAVRWQGTFKVREAANQLFQAAASKGDAVRVWINDELVYDSKKGIQKSVEMEGKKLYAARIEWEHHGEEAPRFELRWGADGRKSIQHGSVFRHMPAPQITPINTNKETAHLHMVSPEPRQIQSKSWGALVDESQYVFFLDNTRDIHESGVVFRGKTGYAQKNELVLFEGEKIAFQDFALEVDGNFGISAVREDKDRFRGRITGREGGTVTLSLPADFNPEGKVVAIHHPQTVEKSRIVKPERMDDHTLRFPVEVSPQKGYLQWELVSQ